MSTCKTCRFWRPPERPVKTFVRGIEKTINRGWCNCGKLDSRDDDGADADDGNTLIHTGPDFGCIHHEAKDEAQCPNAT